MSHFPANEGSGKKFFPELGSAVLGWSKPNHCLLVRTLHSEIERGPMRERLTHLCLAAHHPGHSGPKTRDCNIHGTFSDGSPSSAQRCKRCFQSAAPAPRSWMPFPVYLLHELKSKPPASRTGRGKGGVQKSFGEESLSCCLSDMPRCLPSRRANHILALSSVGQGLCAADVGSTCTKQPEVVDPAEARPWR